MSFPVGSCYLQGHTSLIRRLILYFSGAKDTSSAWVRHMAVWKPNTEDKAQCSSSHLTLGCQSQKEEQKALITSHPNHKKTHHLGHTQQTTQNSYVRAQAHSCIQYPCHTDLKGVVQVLFFNNIKMMLL